MSHLHPDPRKDSTLSHVTSHPLRRALLRLLERRSRITAAEATDEIQGTLERLIYHLRVLERYELVEAAGQPPDLGARYRLTSRGHLALGAMGFEEGGV